MPSTNVITPALVIVNRSAPLDFCIFMFPSEPLPVLAPVRKITSPPAPFPVALPSPPFNSISPPLPSVPAAFWPIIDNAVPSPLPCVGRCNSKALLPPTVVESPLTTNVLDNVTTPLLAAVTALLLADVPSVCISK